MSKPVRTTNIQAHAEAYKRAYVFQDGYVRKRSTGRIVNTSLDSRGSYKMSLAAPGAASINGSANRLIWLIGKGYLPDNMVERSGSLLMCDGDTLQTAYFTEAAHMCAPVAPKDDPMQRYVYGLSPSALCDLYGLVMQRCDEAGINPTTRTRKIVQEVPV